MRCRAAREAGTITREVLTRSERCGMVEHLMSCIGLRTAYGCAGRRATHVLSAGRLRIEYCHLVIPFRRTKLNAQDDRQFYQQPRIVKHVDDRFLAQVDAPEYSASPQHTSRARCVTLQQCDRSAGVQSCGIRVVIMQARC